MTRILTVTKNPVIDITTTTPNVEEGRKLRCSEPQSAAVPPRKHRTTRKTHGRAIVCVSPVAGRPRTRWPG